MGKKDKQVVKKVEKPVEKRMSANNIAALLDQSSDDDLFLTVENQKEKIIDSPSTPSMAFDGEDDEAAENKSLGMRTPS